MSTSPTPVVVGIDVSKATLDVHLLPEGRRLHFTNDPQGWQGLIRALACSSVQCLALEATGGYELALAVELDRAGLPVSIVNPRWVRDFARSVGALAKTDRLDAALIARYAQQVQPKPRGVPDALRRRLQMLVARRRQVVALHTAEANRLERAAGQAELRRLIQPILRLLEKQLQQIDRLLEKAIQDHPLWQHKVEQIDAVPGIGRQTAVLLATRLPELGPMNRQEVAALVGVAPINRDSGQYRGQRMIAGGRSDLRSGLYMPMLSAVRHNPVLQSHYQHLLASGKRKRVAVIACMRKLLVILNTMIKNNQSWNPKLA